MNNHGPTPYGHMLHEYYVEKLRGICAKRSKERQKIKTRADAVRLVTSVRKKIFKSFGPFPARTPLEARVTGILDKGRYTVENVILHSRPNFPVTANLYLPKRRTGKLPAILGACGHAEEGKALELYQSFAQGLALQGYAVLIYDPISQGERHQFLGQKGKHVPRNCCQEHNMMGNQMRLVSNFFGLWRAWDGIRALDYLLTRQEIDRTRVGVTGNSGGGTLSTYLTALDSRFTMAAPSCFVTTYLRNLENELPADAEQIPPRILEQGCDMSDFFIARAPRPTLIMGQKNDYFDTRGTMEVVEEARRIYRLLGKENNLQVFIGPDAHGFHQKNREAMYGFFNTHTGIKKSGREPTIQLADEEELNCTKRGEVAATPCDRVYDFTRRAADDLRESRPVPCGTDLRQTVASVLAVRPVRTVPHFRVLRSLPYDNGKKTFSRFAVETGPGTVGIMHMVSPEPMYHIAGGKSATLYIPHTSSWHDIEASHHKSIGSTGDFYAFNPRGMGECCAQTCSMGGLFSAYGSDYFYASYSSMLGEPYLGRKVHDVLAAARLLKAEGYASVHLAGRGLGALVCAFAAVMSDDVDKVTLLNGLLSYHELTQVPAYKWPLSHLAEGILTRTDLPDIYRELQAKSLTIIDPWHAGMATWKSKDCRAHAKALGINWRTIRFRKPGR